MSANERIWVACLANLANGESGPAAGGGKASLLKAPEAVGRGSESRLRLTPPAEARVAAAAVGARHAFVLSFLRMQQHPTQAQDPTRAKSGAAVAPSLLT